MHKLKSTFFLSIMILGSTTVYGFGWPKYQTSLEKSISEVENATCRSVGWPSVDQMETFVISDKFAPRDFSDRSFYDQGVTLRGESSGLVKDFKKLIHRNTKIKDKSCESILCVNKSVFGEDKGLLFLYLLTKYKLNFSHKSSSKLNGYNVWGERDLNLFKQVLAPIPESVFKGSSQYKVFKHAYFGNTQFLKKETYGKLNPSTKALTLFKPWSRLKSRNQKEYVIFHELAHIIDEKHGSLSDSKEWISFSGWGLRRGKLEWQAKKKNNLISKYARVAPSEDFAESLYAYRYIPAKLKLVAPKKYNFIKNKVFKGLTFDTRGKCYKPSIRLEVSNESTRRAFTASCYYKTHEFERRDQESFEACLLFHAKQ